MLKLKAWITVAALGAASLFLADPASAQSTCTYTTVYQAVLTAGQWGYCWGAKQDLLPSTPLYATGGIMTGPLVTVASSTLSAGLNLPPGTAPTTPNNGDMWTTSLGLYARINGSTVGPMSSPATATTCSQLPALIGDATSSAGSCTVTVGNVKGVTYGASPSTNTVPVVTAPNTVTYEAVPNAALANPATTVNGQTCTLGSTCIITTPYYGFNAPINLGLTASVAANALTINVVGANGSAPASANPVTPTFRSTTAATGTPSSPNITSALSIVIPSGATLGTSNSTPFRIWVFLAYNAGTPELVAAVCSISTGQILPCGSWETNLKTTTTISSGATSAGVPYATTGVSSDVLRIIGYAEYSSGLATAGTWASAPTTLQLMGPGVSRPGSIIQTVTTSTTAVGTTTSLSFVALTTNPISLAIVPSSAVNLIKVTAYGNANLPSGTSTGIQIARSTTLIGNPTYQGAVGGANSSGVYISIFDAPATTSSTTYNIYGKTNAGALSFPYGGGGAGIELDEIMSAVEPANDNPDLRKAA
jgi:hypothetical protein